MVGRLVNMKEKAEEALAYERDSNKELRDRIEALMKSNVDAQEKHRQEMIKQSEKHLNEKNQIKQELKMALLFFQLAQEILIIEWVKMLKYTSDLLN